LAVQFRTEGATEELIEAVAEFDYKVRALARETTVAGSQSSPSKKTRGVRAASAATPGFDNEPPREDADAEDDEESARRELEEFRRTRSLRGDLSSLAHSSPERERSLSPRLYELIGRAFMQYSR